MRLTFLGTGTSHGVPAIACDCSVCRSDDPCNQRSRPSVLIEQDGFTVLVDAAPELRLQAVRHRLRRVDAVLFTHGHADHIGGVDDLRRFSDVLGAELPCYGAPETLRQIRRRFDYAFAPPPPGGGVPRLALRPVDGPWQLGPFRIIPVPVKHGPTNVLGFRVGGLAYVTDCNLIPPASRALLRDLELLVLDALRWVPHPTHFTVEEALAVIAELRPRRALLTHIAHDLDHATTNALLPPEVRLAYDGQVVAI